MERTSASLTAACTSNTQRWRGFLLGAVLFCVDFPAVSAQLIGLDADGEPRRFVSDDLGIPFLLQAFWLFVISSAIFVGVSLCTRPPTADCVERHCWSHPLAALTGRPLSGALDPRLCALLLVAVMAGLYLAFG